MNVARFARVNARVIVFGVICVTLAGLYSITVLPSGIYPEVEFPRIAVVAHSGDLSPRLMMSFNVTGDMPAADLRDIAMFQIRPLLSRIPGVSRVDVSATDEREVSVIVDPGKLNATRLTLDQVSQALKNTNQITSVGRLPKDYQQHLVLATGELANLDGVRQTVVAFRNQTPVYVGDIAEVRGGVVDRTTLITGNGQPAAVINVARQIRGNILAIAQGVEQTLREGARSLPPAIRISKVYDLAAFVSEAVRSVSEAIVIGTFFILHIANGTINLMSMGGLAIAIGLVIDDAIVVVENIHRHLAAGDTPEVAAERGTNELFGAVVGSTLTTVVVFVPLGLLQGMVGQFFAALSLTLSGAVLLSLVYALLFIPVPAARMLRARLKGRPEGLRYDSQGAAHDGQGAAHDGRSADLQVRRDPGWLGRRYESFLRGALSRPAWVIAVTLVVAVVGGLLYFRLETGFLPDMDEGGYVIDYWTPPGTSLQETDRMVHRIETVLEKTPEIASFTRRTGTEMGMFATEQSSGDILVRLKPRGQRDKTVEDLIADEREQFAKEMSGMTIEFVQILQDMLGDLQGTPEPIEVKLFGDDIDTLEALSARIGEKLKAIDGIVDLVEPRRGNPELEVRVDPTRAAKAGFSTQEVSTQLADGLLGDVATQVRRADRLVDLRVRYPDTYRFNASWIREYPLVTEAGAVVPLSATADVVPVEGTAELFREDLKQMVPTTARLEGRDMGSVVEEVKKVLESERLPVGYTAQIGGQYETQQESFTSLMVVLAIALLLVFGLLVGLIVKNGIILIDYADRLEAEGQDRKSALVRAGAIRLRPILMTTLCTLFGLLPLALGLGAGAELQKPLAIAVIGGLSVSTIVTLVFVPTLMSLLPQRHHP